MKPGSIFFIFFTCIGLSFATAQPLIIDHNCTVLSKVPGHWVEKARSDFRLAYAHTSHGSQIVSGMSRLANENPSMYSYSTQGAGSTFAMHDGFVGGDLGHAGDTSWAFRTRAYLLNQGSDRNMIMWSWCGGCSDNTPEGIAAYLTAMNQLEVEFPSVTFVYMTGHLDGSGIQGNLNLRNEQIRDYCRANSKVLFDFADIESYDPDGKYFLDKFADDACYYIGTDGKRYNWAGEWCAVNPGICGTNSCAHSHSLNCYEKGKAFWWMMARLAGWDGTEVNSVSGIVAAESFKLTVSPNPASGSAMLQFRLDNARSVEITLWSTLGGRIATVLEKKRLDQGQHSVRFLKDDIPAGIYYVMLRTESSFVRKKLVVL
jgi:hypothetical protein